ncbi:MAG: 5'-nucleotidase [Armatimonadota bacterium]
MKARIVRFGWIAAIMLIAMSSAFAATATSRSALGTLGVQKSEVSLGDLVADAIRASAGANAAFVSASELKESSTQIPAGKVSTEDVTAYIAYTDDPIVVVRLTGRQIKQALERSVLIYPKNNLGFLQVSGISFTFNPDGPQEGRLASVSIGGSPISDSTAYSVAMTSSMANGALGYWKIWTKNDIVNTTDVTIPKAIDQFFTGNSSIDYSNLNRIKTGK